jgi:hypothetical protein
MLYKEVKAFILPTNIKPTDKKSGSSLFNYKRGIGIRKKDSRKVFSLKHHIRYVSCNML